MKALIIKDPYISYILDGQKTWEMRSTSTKQRGLIALIKKGTGKIWGIARLVDAKGPLERDVIIREADKHRIPVEEILSGAVDKWNYAWVIGDVIVLPEPIPYHHPNGAVIWVTLDENVADEVMAFAEGNNHRKNADEGVSARSNSAATLQVPFARDGTFFGPETRNSKGLYRVGSKDNERVFKSFSDALDYLKSMPVAKWRRPNAAGNWGIVSAASWGNAPFIVTSSTITPTSQKTASQIKQKRNRSGRKNKRTVSRKYVQNRARKRMGITEWLLWVGASISIFGWFK